MASFGKKHFYTLGDASTAREMFDARARRTAPVGGCAPRTNFCGLSRCLFVKHPGIIAERWRKLAFATNAIFSRFPNKNLENATLTKNSFNHEIPETLKILNRRQQRERRRQRHRPTRRWTEYYFSKNSTRSSYKPERFA
jgi:hypothetical protein